jgi:hypothetical protein
MTSRAAKSNEMLPHDQRSDLENNPIACPNKGVPDPDLDEAGAPVLIEVICERVHCVMYEYAMTTVQFVAEDYEGKVEVRPVVRRGNRENAERFMELCRINGRHLSVPTILIDGKVAFTDVPGPEEIRQAIESGLANAKQTG